MNATMKWKSTLLSLLILFAYCSAYAQERTVTGTVTSEDQESLPGVNIVIKGTTHGAVTDMDGNYSIVVPGPEAVLELSYIGYSTITIPVGNQLIIDAVLSSDVTELDEIVVTGYTSVRKGDITGAVAIVDMEGLNQLTSASVLNKLEGRASGVVINNSGQPGGRNTVRIRGISSFTNNDPLYIVDGVPVESSHLNFLNSNDIMSMQILKDPSTASVYGARANNGVIIITTKKGKAGKAKLSINVNQGVQTPINGFDKLLMQDPLEFHEVMKQSFENAGLPVPQNIYGDPNNPSIPNYIWPNDGVNQTTSVDESLYSYPDYLIMPGSQGTNWWDEVFDPSLVQDYNIGMSGGNESSVYNVSVQYYNQDGTMKYNGMDRFSIRTNTEFSYGNLKIGENLSVSRTQMTGGFGGDSQNMSENSAVGSIIKRQTVIPVYDIAGNFAGAKANTTGNGSNPVAQAYRSKDNGSFQNVIVGNFFATYDIIDGMQFKSSFGVNASNLNYKGFSYPTPEDAEPSLTRKLDESYATNLEWTWTNTLSYIKSFGEHNINALVGYEAIDTRRNSMNASMSGYITTDMAAWYIQDALGDPDTKNAFSYGYKSSLVSLFGKVDYNFANKYYLSGTIRRDGSSKFGENHRFGVFPAVSAGWRISEESFMQDLTWLSDLRFRGGWGITGNQNIPAGRIVNQYGGSVETTFYDISGANNSVASGYRLTATGNPDMKWEENVSTNVGFDFSMLERRINFVFDWYKRNVNDLLYGPELPAAAGNASPPIVNIGTMENQGIDFSIGYKSSLKGDFRWEIELIGSHYRNEIVKIDGVQDYFFGPVSGRKGSIVINQLGSPIGSFFGYVQDGIFQNQSEVDAHVAQDGKAVGRFRFKDINNDGVINGDDRDIIGSPHPDFTGGINLSAFWKNFDMSLFIFGSYGNDIFDMTKEFTVFRQYNSNVLKDRITNAWRPDNTDGIYPMLDENDQYSIQYNSFYVEDASYIRLKNFQIGYTVPKMLWFDSIRFYIQGQNLFTLTKYTGLDPALPTISTTGSSGNQADQAMGIDRGAYPANKIFSIGIYANF